MRSTTALSILPLVGEGFVSLLREKVGEFPLPFLLAMAPTLVVGLNR